MGLLDSLFFALHSFVLLFLLSFFHNWSKVFALAASIYPVRFSRKILGLYFSLFLVFNSLTTPFLSRSRSFWGADNNPFGTLGSRNWGVWNFVEGSGTWNTPAGFFEDDCLKEAQENPLPEGLFMGVRGYLVPASKFLPEAWVYVKRRQAKAVGKGLVYYAFRCLRLRIGNLTWDILSYLEKILFWVVYTFG